MLLKRRKQFLKRSPPQANKLQLKVRLVLLSRHLRSKLRGKLLLLLRRRMTKRRFKLRLQLSLLLRRLRSLLPKRRIKRRQLLKSQLIRKRLIKIQKNRRNQLLPRRLPPLSDPRDQHQPRSQSLRKRLYRRKKHLHLPTRSRRGSEVLVSLY